MKAVGADARGRGEFQHRAPARVGIIRFLLLFALYLIVGNVLLSLHPVETGFVEPWTRFNATGSAALARLTGIEAQANGTQVSYESGTLNILIGCNGVEALLILVSSLFAFPSSWGRRLIGVLAGTVVILGANLLRLLNLILIARFFPNWLEFFHIYIWQTLMVLIAFAIFLSWGLFVARVEPVAGRSGDA
jgi:exosortase H (IPTLxxWG-CTERM-specific)